MKQGLTKWISLLWALSSLGCDEPHTEDATLNYYEHVAPILYEHCTSCHRPGQSAPFSLLQYRDAKKRAKQIAKVTTERFMPPWLPAPVDVDYKENRSMSPEDIKTLRDWVAAGTLEGDAAKGPPVPESTSDWALGPPDMILEMNEAYPLSADVAEEYRNFVIPIPDGPLKYVRALEIKPVDPRLVHHAILQSDETRSSRMLDQRDPGLGYRGMAYNDRAIPPGGHFLGWTPGSVISPLPDGMNWPLVPGHDLILKLHMIAPTGKPESVRVRLGLYLDSAPATLVPTGILLSVKDIAIEPGVTDYLSEQHYTLPVPLDVLSVYPHAHYLARNLEGWATLPDGTEKRLLHIPEWDLNWQGAYQLRSPLRLPAGSVLSMRYSYDNSESNPRNPSHPPKRVVYGPESTDEMGELFFQVLTLDDGDRATLEMSLGQFALEKDVLYYEIKCRENPTDPEPHVSLAKSLEKLLRFEDAESHLKTAIALAPGESRFEEALARHQTIVLARGKIRALKALIKQNPSRADLHRRLGVLLIQIEYPTLALQSFRQAVSLQPMSAVAHRDLGVALAQQGRIQEAMECLKKALEIDPEYEAAQHAMRALKSSSLENN